MRGCSPTRTVVAVVTKADFIFHKFTEIFQSHGRINRACLTGIFLFIFNQYSIRLCGMTGREWIGGIPLIIRTYATIHRRWRILFLLFIGKRFPPFIPKILPVPYNIPLWCKERINASHPDCSECDDN